MFHDIKEADQASGYIVCQRNGYDRDYSHGGADTIVVTVREAGKHAYARVAYQRAAQKKIALTLDVCTA